MKTSINWGRMLGAIETTKPEAFWKYSLKSPGEKAIYEQSEEFQSAQNSERCYSVIFSEDGSFKSEDVLPGGYQLIAYPKLNAQNFKDFFRLTGKIIIPEPTDKNSDDPMNVGVINLTREITPKPNATNSESVQLNGSFPNAIETESRSGDAKNLIQIDGRHIVHSGNSNGPVSITGNPQLRYWKDETSPGVVISNATSLTWDPGSHKFSAQGPFEISPPQAAQDQCYTIAQITLCRCK